MPAHLKPLSPTDVAVAANVGRQLGRGEIDAATALRLLRGWVQQSTSPSWRITDKARHGR